MFYPEIYRIDLTSQCNLNCIHCQSRHLRSLSDLNTEQWISIIDQLVEFGATYFIFLGGESLFRQDLFLILDHIKKNNVKLSLTTNGTLLNEELCDKLLNHYNASIIISLDGYDDESHDHIRGSGTFKKVIKSFEFCKKSQKDKNNSLVGASVTLHKKNVEHVERFIDFSNNYNLDFLAFAEVTACGFAKENWDNLKIDLEDLADAGERLAMKILEDSQVPVVRADFFSSIFRKYLQEKRGVDYPQETRVECASLYECYIESNGKVYPNQQVSELMPDSLKGAEKFGLSFSDNSLLVKSIEDIWFGEQFEKYRGFVMRRDYVNMCSPCNSCEFAKSYCIPSPRLAFESDIENHDLCTYSHEKLRG